MTNIGAFPLEPESNITAFRILAGDAVATPTETPGGGIFELWSDDDIRLYLELYPDNTHRAISAAYRALAGQAAVIAQMSKDYDTTLDNTKRSAQLHAVADFHAAEADKLDAVGDNAPEFFTMFGGESAEQECRCHPEASPWRLDQCRC